MSDHSSPARQDSLLIELLVEELPPKALSSLGEAFATLFTQQLAVQGLLAQGHQAQIFASPRRLGVRLTAVRAKADSKAVSQKLMPASVGLGGDGQASPALLKKLQSLGLDAEAAARAAAHLRRESDGKVESLFYDSTQEGVTIEDGAQLALTHAIAKLPIPKVMTYQLESDCDLPGWSSVQFVRPAHGLVALYGERVLPLHALGLRAGKRTLGHRFESMSMEADGAITLQHADEYESTLERVGAVIPSYTKRRASIVVQLEAAAAQLSAPQSKLTPIQDEALLDEVTALVERPHVMACQFDEVFLNVPQECLILTMKANQKYFPLLAEDGRLSKHFLLVSNINPADPSFVVDGNERVIRPRLADAQFFFEQDRKKTLAERTPQLAKVVYHNQLGSQAERSERVALISEAIVHQWRDAVSPFTVELKEDMEMLAHKAGQAARLAKCDLVTDMVGEFPELQGIMGAYYARFEGLRDGVSIAIEDHYKPRFAGDSLPRNRTGTVVALADKLETLVGMFGIGNLPTGDKDPFALRRHALGVIRILMENKLPLPLTALLAQTASVFGGAVADAGATVQAVQTFIFERLGGVLREQGYSAQEVDAVLSLQPQVLSDIGARLEAVRHFAALPESAALSSANKRVNNILKKNAADTSEKPDYDLLSQAEELALLAKMQALLPQSEALLAERNYTAQLQLVASLAPEVDAFFDKVMVMADDPQLRAQRLNLLSGLQWQMNQVADISKLAS